MAKKAVDVPPTNFLIGLGTTHKVSILNPTGASSAPVLKANPSIKPNIVIRPNHFVKVVLQGNLRESEIIVGAAPSGAFFQQTVNLKPGRTVVLQAGTFSKRFSVIKK